MPGAGQEVGRGACGVVAKTKAKKQLAPLARGEPKGRLYTRADVTRERLERSSDRCLPGRLIGGPSTYADDDAYRRSHGILLTVDSVVRGVAGSVPAAVADAV